MTQTHLPKQHHRLRGSPDPRTPSSTVHTKHTSPCDPTPGSRHPTVPNEICGPQANTCLLLGKTLPAGPLCSAVSPWRHWWPALLHSEGQLRTTTVVRSVLQQPPTPSPTPGQELPPSQRCPVLSKLGPHHGHSDSSRVPGSQLPRWQQALGSATTQVRGGRPDACIASCAALKVALPQ